MKVPTTARQHPARNTPIADLATKEELMWRAQVLEDEALALMSEMKRITGSSSRTMEDSNRMRVLPIMYAERNHDFEQVLLQLRQRFGIIV